MARRARHRRSSSRAKRALRKRLTNWAIILFGLGIAGLVIWNSARWLGIGKSEAPLKLTMDEARAINTDIPFVDGPVRPAKPFMFRGSAKTRQEAVDCLATAAIYETGRSSDGQRAVIQVILNRVRNAGFPKTICGVVYQGSNKSTGCQFSFACDRSLTRRREPRGWSAARHRASRALQGYVYAAVGTATHYHTDWVVPYWSAALDKIAKVDTHIFYRRPVPKKG